MGKSITGESDLIEEILRGNRNDYKILIDRYAPMVFHIVRSYVDSGDDAEELAQQIFVKTYERLGSFNKKAKFSSWLYKIAQNHCRDYTKNIRRNNKRFSDMEKHELENNMPQDKSAEHLIEAMEWKQLLDEALAHINRDQATAFLMKYRDDMSYKAMSTRLGDSVSALKVRVHRARKELKSFIIANR